MQTFWQQKRLLNKLLLPVAWLFQQVAAGRRLLYQRGILPSYSCPVPVIVVGNIAIGGTGKTPVVIYLAQQLQQAGLTVGIVSRGYKARTKQYPAVVTARSAPALFGDEPVLLARQTGCPVVIDPRRPRAVAHLLAHFPCDVILTDDGLQHYALQRDIEIAVVNSAHNGYCLPAGALREPLSRLRTVDYVINSGAAAAPGEFALSLQPQQFVAVASEATRDVDSFRGQTCHAIAGIGQPQQFFASLRQLGINIIEHAFPDHYAFRLADLQFDDDYPLLMTAKDAIKCENFALTNAWYLSVTARLDPRFIQTLLRALRPQLPRKPTT